MTFSSAEDFKFRLADYLSPGALESGEGLVVGDGGRLIPDDADMAGKEEFFK